MMSRNATGVRIFASSRYIGAAGSAGSNLDTPGPLGSRSTNTVSPGFALMDRPSRGFARRADATRGVLYLAEVHPVSVTTASSGLPPMSQEPAWSLHPQLAKDTVEVGDLLLAR